MRICQHYIKDSKGCSLGVSPVKCRSCSMFQAVSRRTFIQPTIDQIPLSVSSSSAEVASISHSTNAFSTVSSSEQQILQSSAVRGGCGCSKK